MTKTALILGATGRFGRHMAQALQATGWRTPAFARKTHDLNREAKSVDVIVYGWNPPYNKWAGQCLEQLQQVIAAARINKATILFPGNVYPFGTKMPEVLVESTPHLAGNSLGVLRKNMENMLKESGVRTIILRAGDFIDTQASGNWFDGIITKKTAKSGKISYPGNPEIAHAWAYLPDYTRAFAGLVEIRDDLPIFTQLNFAGYTLTGVELADVLGAEVQKMNWLPIKIARPFWPMAKYLLQMRYLWNTPHQMDDKALRALLPHWQETPMQQALASAGSFKVNPDQPMIRTGATV